MTDHDDVRAPLDRLLPLIAALTVVPTRWAALMIGAASLSVLHVKIGSGEPFGVSLGVSTLTPVLLALMWLPALLKILGVAGGAVKTPAGEATFAGIAGVLDVLDRETKQDTLPTIITALSTAEPQNPRESRQLSRAFRRDLELQLAAVIPMTGGVRETLDRLAAEYEDIRRRSESSRDRTMRMTTLTAEARAIARAAPIAFIDIQNMLQNGSEGERVIALAIAQDQPDQRLFPLVANAIKDSHSAFEQYQALGAAFEMAALLDGPQKAELRKVLQSALDDPTRSITEDTSRARLVDAILRAIG